MRWTDEATWDDTLVWDDTDTMESVSAVETTASANAPPAVDTMELIRRSVPAKLAVMGGLTADSEITDLLPDNIYLDKIIIAEGAGNSGQLSCGTSAGGFEIFTSESVLASDKIPINVNRIIPVGSSIFLHDAGTGDTWNSMTVTIYFLYWEL